MSREAHVRFSEGLGVKFPRATHLERGRVAPLTSDYWQQGVFDVLSMEARFTLGGRAHS